MSSKRSKRNNKNNNLDKGDIEENNPPAKPLKGKDAGLLSAIDATYGDMFAFKDETEIKKEKSHEDDLLEVHDLIDLLAEQSEIKVPLKNNVILETVGGMRPLEFFSARESKKIDSKNDVPEKPPRKYRNLVLTAIGFWLLVLCLSAFVSILVFSEEEESRAVQINISTIQPTTFPTIIPTTSDDTQTESPTEETKTETDSPTEESTSFPPTGTPLPITLFPTENPTQKPSVSPTKFPTFEVTENLNRCANVPNQDDWKFCYSDSSLGKCIRVNGEMVEEEEATDCLTKSRQRFFCRCPNVDTFRQQFGCVDEDDLNTGCD